MPLLLQIILNKMKKKDNSLLMARIHNRKCPINKKVQDFKKKRPRIQHKLT